MKKPDINFLSITDPGTVIEDRQIIVPKAAPGSYWSDAVHINVPNVVLRHCVIDARECEENAIDGNRASGLIVEDCEIWAGAECALYLKGGTRGARFRRILIKWIGGHCDLYVGDYSDQSHQWSKDNTFEDLARSDGEPVRVRRAWGDWPVITGNSLANRQVIVSAGCFCYVGAKTLFESVKV